MSRRKQDRPQQLVSNHSRIETTDLPTENTTCSALTQGEVNDLSVQCDVL